jgi:catechol 2,3-dioxygenase
MTVLSHQAPVHIGAVSLAVRNLTGVSDFYEKALGLSRLSASGHERELGAGGVSLLRLIEDKSARVPDRREAGLFHTAFLLPTREDLARWTAHAMANNIPVTGASDHLVSEALYLDDPEGNGIEIYRDRAPNKWTRTATGIQMATEALDFKSLMATIEGEVPSWKAAPEGTRVGHIHLKVGDTGIAENFYRDELGFDVMTEYPGASFLASGGYHHHIGANVWASRNAPKREPSLGLASFELVADATHHAKLAAKLATSSADPWGNRIVLREKTA